MTNNNESLNLRLIWEDPNSGEKMDRTFSLPISIGRDVSNKVVLAETSVSRFHAQIDIENGQVILKDLQSSNGTVLNGQNINDRTGLSEGDELRVGNTT
ncbi:MAG TPA: FHA domain-containing protein, partial [Aggregatilineales bacterium]|nr:FHA domain-containing protein [Aggregatilineales bacterium]